MKKTLYKLLIGIFSLIILSSCGGVVQDEVFVAPVVTQEARIGSIPTTLTFTGTMSPNTETVISSKVSGVVLEITKDVGDTVREGAAIAELDAELASVQLGGIGQNISSLLAQKDAVDSLYNQRIQDANVNLNNTLALNNRLINILQTQIYNANYTDLSNAKDLRDAGVDVLEEQLDALEDIQLDNAEDISQAQLDFLRQQLDLSEVDGGLSDKQYDVAEIEARANIDEIEAQIDILEEQIDQAFTQGNASIDSVENQIEILERQLDRAHAEIKLNTDQMRQAATLIALEKSNMLAELDSAISQFNAQKSQTALIAEYATIRAPYDAIVTDKFVEVGQLVAPGSPIVKISTAEKFQVIVEVPDNLLADISNIETVELTFDALGDEVFLADVTNISPSTDLVSKKISIELTLQDENKSFIPGLFARVTFELAPSEGLIVDSTAVISSYGQSYLFVNLSGIARKRIVTILSRDNDMVIIEGDILSAEEIIISGNKWLRDGDSVSAKPKLLPRFK